MMNTAATTPVLSCFATSEHHVGAQQLVSAMTGLTAIDVLAADASPSAGGPAWIKITPRGRWTARDGRSFETIPETLVARFTADGVSVPIDIDHATVKKALFGEAAPAVGWIEELEARADGTYGRVEWLAPGLEVLAARSHHYISPSLKADDEGRASWLHSAALVAAPGISMPAVASAVFSHTPEKPMFKALAQALGLNPDASEQSCLSAIATLTTRIDPAIHQEALATLAARTSELEGLKKAARDEKVHSLLEGALKAKKIAPAQRASYEALCATDDGLAQVTALLETFGTGLAPSVLDQKQTPGVITTLSAEDREVMTQMGLSEEEFRKANGLTAV